MGFVENKKNVPDSALSFQSKALIIHMCQTEICYILMCRVKLIASEFIFIAQTLAIISAVALNKLSM